MPQKIFVVGNTNDRVFQYNAPTDWSLTSATYDSVSLSISAQDDNPIGVRFKNDGKKLYFSGLNSNTIYQYSLPTAWSLTSGTYDSVSLSITSQSNGIRDFFFKPDGTKLYVIGLTNRRVYQYSLSTAWSLSSATYDSVSFLFSSQTTSGYSLGISTDGTKMFIVGEDEVRIFQYTLSTPWVVSSATYDSISLDTSGQDNQPTCVFFKTDGTKLYLSASQNNRIYQYSMPTAWSLTSASYDSVFLAVGSQDVDPRGVAMQIEEVITFRPIIAMF